MTWEKLYENIGNQNLSIISKTEVMAIINEKKVPLILKFKTDGTPYLAPRNKEK